MFPQLPPINELHIDILCQILKNKTWRPKINILENVNKRTLEKENSTILIPTLFSFLNDKIAIVRSSVVISLSIILSENKVKLQSVY